MDKGFVRLMHLILFFSRIGGVNLYRGVFALAR